MQENPSKADILIEDGVEALRAERAPQFDTDAIRNRLAKRPNRALAPIAVASFAIAGAAIVLLPRVSAAADLDKLGDALATLPPRQEVHLVATSGGEYEVALELIVSEDEVVLQDNGKAKQKWKDDRLTTEFGAYTTIQDAKVPDWTTKTFLLGDWLRRADPRTVQRKKVKAADVLPNSVLVQRMAIDPQLVLERVAFDVKLDSVLTGHVVFNVEPETLRPVLVQAQLAGKQEINVVLGYALQLTATSQPSNVETYDIDLQRKQIIESFTSPHASAEVGGTTVLLHLAIVDHEGNLTLIYSGSEALPTDLDKSRVFEGQGDGATLPTMQQPFGQLQVSLLSVRLEPDVKAEDVPIILLGRLFSAKGPELLDIQIPVMVKGILHWVPFKEVPFVRTGSNLQLVAPTNTPFWLDPPSEPTVE